MSSNVKFYEDILGSDITNYQLWIELSDGTFKKSDSTYNELVVRNRRSRPRKTQLSSATVDLIRADSINQLLEIIKGGGTFTLVLELEPNNDTETIKPSRIPSNNIF